MLLSTPTDSTIKASSTCCCGPKRTRCVSKWSIMEYANRPRQRHRWAVEASRSCVSNTRWHTWRRGQPHRQRPSTAVVERRRQRAATIASPLRSTTTFIIYGTAFVLIIGEFGVTLAPIIAGAGTLGVAVGFSSQAAPARRGASHRWLANSCEALIFSSGSASASWRADGVAARARQS